MKNANQLHKESLTLAKKFALVVTDFIGTMWCVGLFTLIALVSLPETIATHNLITIVAWIAQTFLQRVLLSLIMVGQNIASEHAEIRADLDYQTNLKAEKEIKSLHKKIDILIGKKKHG